MTLPTAPRPRLALVALLALLTSGAAAWQARPLTAVAPPPFPPGQAPRIDVAFVLDATGSMSGLIEGAKRKIWTLANELADAQPAPDLRIALVAYRDRGDDFVTRRIDLTGDLDAVFAELTQLQAAGGGDGPESVNQALHEAVNQLAWREGRGVYRAIFLVGDAPPHMDYPQEVQWPATLERARERGIVVNAVQCGAISATAQVWRAIATQGAGEYAAIAQDGAMVAVATPHDEKLAQLNRELAATVVPWGSEEEKAELASKAGLAASAPAEAAASRFRYMKRFAEDRANLGRRDLVDALAAGEVELESLDEAELPASLQALAPEARSEAVEQVKERRKRLQGELDAVVAERDAYLAESAAERADADDAFDARVLDAARRQAAAAAGVVYAD